MSPVTFTLGRWENKGAGVRVYYAKLPCGSAVRRPKCLTAFRMTEHDAPGNAKPATRHRVEMAQVVGGKWSAWQSVDGGKSHKLTDAKRVVREFIAKQRALPNPRRANGWFGPNRRPMHGESAVEQYERVHWGDRARRVLRVATPALTRRQPLVTMGKLRMLHVVTHDGRELCLKPSKPYPFLAFGQLDNRLYILGGSTDHEAQKRGWGAPGSVYTVLRVDYDASKAGEPVYWYHAHERPFPKLRILRSGHPAYAGGKYKVAPEGIVG